MKRGISVVFVAKVYKKEEEREREKISMVEMETNGHLKFLIL